MLSNEFCLAGVSGASQSESGLAFSYQIHGLQLGNFLVTKATGAHEDIVLYTYVCIEGLHS